MVGGEAVDDVQVFPESLHVLSCSQHGSDLRPSVADVLHVFLAKEEVMRCHLTCDLDAFLLRRSDDQDLKKQKVKSLIMSTAELQRLVDRKKLVEISGQLLTHHSFFR